MLRSATLDCPHCGACNEGEWQVDEDGGSVAIETTRCASAGCENLMCPGCDQFHCGGCGEYFCRDHAATFAGVAMCLGCIEECEPDCTCVRIAEDLDDATRCELCNPGSAWNRARRELEPQRAHAPAEPDPLVVVMALGLAAVERALGRAVRLRGAA